MNEHDEETGLMGPSTTKAVNPFGDAKATAAVQAGGGGLEIGSAREIAEVQASVIMAKRFPRDPVQCMDRILTACQRPSMAVKAQYQYARGGTDITGPSVRLAEELARGWGNMVSGVREVSRGVDERGVGYSECVAYAWDLETNVREERYFRVPHWRDTKGGGYKISDARDVYEKVANDGARRRRACVLAMIPADVQEEAIKQCQLTLQSAFEVTPDSIKEVLKRFEGVGVTKDQIEERIQRRIDTMTPAIYVSLVNIYNSISDGMSTALDWFTFGDDFGGERDGDPNSRVNALNERIARMRAKRKDGGEEPAAGGLCRRTTRTSGRRS